MSAAAAVFLFLFFLSRPFRAARRLTQPASHPAFANCRAANRDRDGDGRLAVGPHSRESGLLIVMGRIWSPQSGLTRSRLGCLTGWQACGRRRRARRGATFTPMGNCICAAAARRLKRDSSFRAGRAKTATWPVRRDM